MAMTTKRKLALAILCSLLMVCLFVFVLFNPALRTIEIVNVSAIEANQHLSDVLQLPESAHNVSLEAYEYRGPAYHVKFDVDHNARDKYIQDIETRLKCKLNPVAKEQMMSVEWQLNDGPPWFKPDCKVSNVLRTDNCGRSTTYVVYQQSEDTVFVANYNL